MSTAVAIPPPRRTDLVIGLPGDDGRSIAKDPQTGEYFALGEQERFLLEQLDGEQTADAICAAFEERFSEPFGEPDLDEFLELATVRRFVQSPESDPAECKTETRGPGVSDTKSACAAVQAAAAPKSSSAPQRPASRQSLLYWRKSLFDPDRLFTWLEPRLSFFWTRTFLVLSAGCIMTAVVLVTANGQALAGNFAQSIRWETAVLAWLTLLAVTTCHEFAHGLTCKHYGGEVHEVGYLSMLLMPCLYCNVSDAWLFREKSKRLWVTFAGGYFELFLWSLAVFIWRLTQQDTLLNYLAWVIASVTGVRWFFNFNPLLKLDGYYLLSDWSEIPNLHARANTYLKDHIRWMLWGSAKPDRNRRHRFLLLYGAASWLFSVVFLTLIVVAFGRFLQGIFGTVGLCCGVLLGVVLLPRLFRGLVNAEIGKMIRIRRKRTASWLLALGMLAAVSFLVQIEDRSAGAFQLRPAKRLELRAPVSGFLKFVDVDEGDQVSRGTHIATLEVPDLSSRIDQKAAELEEAKANLRLLEVGVRPEEILEQERAVRRASIWRDLARQELERKRLALREELARLDQQIAQTRVEFDHAVAAYRRAESLHSQAVVSDNDFLEARKKAHVLHAQWQQTEADKRAREAQGTLEAEAELARREKELAEAESALSLLQAGTRPEELDAARSKVTRLDAEMRYLKTIQDKLKVYCPASGIVTTPRVKEQVGQYLDEGDLICEIDDTAFLEVEIDLDEEQVARVQTSQEVQIKARALPFETFQATVQRIAPKAVADDLQSQLTIYCRLDDPEGKLRPGMTGHARIFTGQRRVAGILSDRVLRFLRTEFWW